jgi:hypothetical protein
MKPTIFALVSLVLGVAIGIYLTTQEISDRELPINVSEVGSGLTLRPGGTGHLGPIAEVVNGERHNFGTMDRNELGSHTFVIRNSGDEPLTLTKGKTTCKCTVFELRDDVLEPGQQAEVLLEWDAKSSLQEFEQSATIMINEHARPSLQLSVHGRVVESVRADPYDVLFNDVSANESATATVMLYAHKHENLQVEKYEFQVAKQAEFFTATFEPVPPEEIDGDVEAASALRMTLELKPGLPVGLIDQAIRLTTNASPETPVEIRISGQIVTDISLVGPRVYPDRMLISLDTLERSKGGKSKVYLLVKGPHRNETQLSVASVEPEGEFTATIGEPIRHNEKVVRYPLTIEVPPGTLSVSRASQGSYGKIRIATTHPLVKELILNLRYVVKDDE